MFGGFFSEFILGDLALARAAFPQRINQSQNLAARGHRSGRMQWLNSISEAFSRGRSSRAGKNWPELGLICVCADKGFKREVVCAVVWTIKSPTQQSRDVLNPNPAELTTENRHRDHRG